MTTLNRYIKTTGKTLFNFEEFQNQDKLVLTLKDVKIEKLPDGKVEVYLNLPANKKPDPGSKYFVGLLDMFSLQSVSIGHRANHIVKVHDINLDASISAEALGLNLRDLKKAVITIIVF